MTARARGTNIRSVMQRDLERKIERRIRLWIAEQERDQRRTALLKRATAVRPVPRRQHRAR